MRKGQTVKIFAVVFFVILLALQIFGVAGLLRPYTSAQIAEGYETLIYPYRFHLIFSFVLDFFVMLYLLYSWDIIGKEKSEFDRTYLAIADVGLNLLELLGIVNVYLLHRGLFAVNLVLHILMVLTLVRIISAFPLRGKNFLFAKFPFDLSLGISIFSTYLSLALIFVASEEALQLFTDNARAVLLILALTLTAMVLGLRLKNLFFLFSIMAYEGAIAVQHLSKQGFDGRYPEIYLALILSMAGLIAAIIVVFIQRKKT